ncbi:hypothetical protein AXF42_Ash020140 [Apostasia shenzhenica]|uniref:Uncharacterized protein n=1 Tax=Apostasia shenzhenica TaxID=1088818 RepID=A0A2I0A3S5_9ASPA|nr:hypothetical protein AXF42_Ash020140 [Apostasia shenzhenica]
MQRVLSFPICAEAAPPATAPAAVQRIISCPICAEGGKLRNFAKIEALVTHLNIPMSATAPPDVQRILSCPICAEYGKHRNFTKSRALVTHLNIPMVAAAPPATAPPSVQRNLSFPICAEAAKLKNFAKIGALVTHLIISMVVRFGAMFFGQWLICKSMAEKRTGHSAAPLAAAPLAVQRVLFFPICAHEGAAAQPATAPPAVQRVLSCPICAEGGKPRISPRSKQLLHQLCNASFPSRSVLKVGSSGILPRSGLLLHLNIHMVLRFVAMFSGQWLICKSIAEKRTDHTAAQPATALPTVQCVLSFPICAEDFIELVLNLSNRCNATSCATRHFCPIFAEAAAPPTVQHILSCPICAEGGMPRNFVKIGALVTHFNIPLVVRFVAIIGIFKFVTKAPILAKFLDFPRSAQIRKERMRCTAGGAAAGGATAKKLRH